MTTIERTQAALTLLIFFVLCDAGRAVPPAPALHHNSHEVESLGGSQRALKTLRNNAPSVWGSEVPFPWSEALGFWDASGIEMYFKFESAISSEGEKTLVATIYDQVTNAVLATAELSPCFNGRILGADTKIRGRMHRLLLRAYDESSLWSTSFKLVMSMEQMEGSRKVIDIVLRPRP